MPSTVHIPLFFYISSRPYSQNIFPEEGETAQNRAAAELYPGNANLWNPPGWVDESQKHPTNFGLKVEGGGGGTCESVQSKAPPPSIHRMSRQRRQSAAAFTQRTNKV